MKKWQKIFLQSLSYVLVAAAASFVTLALLSGGSTKLLELQTIIERRFIGNADMDAVRDAAAAAMVDAIDDRWSYYIPAEKYAAYEENKNNAYVGVGITIVQREDGTGFDIQQVTPGGSAQEAGILPGDILFEADGESAADMTVDELRDKIRGQKGTEVTVGVLRSGETLSFVLERREIHTQVAASQMLDGNIGLVTIANFNTNCADETITAVEALLEQGAESLIFDVRNNGGGYVTEMLEVLD